MGSWELSAQVCLQWGACQSQPPKWLGLQAWTTSTQPHELCVCYGIWTQGPKLARQVLYSLSRAPAIFLIICFSNRGSGFCLGRLWISILLPCLQSSWVYRVMSPSLARFFFFNKGTPHWLLSNLLFSCNDIWWHSFQIIKFNSPALLLITWQIPWCDYAIAPVVPNFDLVVCCQLSHSENAAMNTLDYFLKKNSWQFPCNSWKLRVKRHL
jgi:hypothetical protein